MGMIECRECKAHISDTATQCPKCGYKGRKSGMSTIGQAILWLIFVFVILPAGCLAIGESSRNNSSSSSPNSSSSTPAAVVEAPAQTNWDYLYESDPMSGKNYKTATALSSNTVSFSFPYKGPQHGKLRIWQHPKDGLLITFSLEKGQILCSSYSGCPISIKFDNNSEIRFSGTEPADNSSNIVFINSEKKFVALAKKSKTILVQVNVYQQGAPVFQFEPSELIWP